jgi:serine/threonine-protein kinase RsbW
MDEKTRVVEIRVPSELGYEKMAMKLAGAVAQKMGFASDRVEGLKTAVAEACLNAIEHGNQLDANTHVLVLLSIDDDRLAIDVKDEGRGGAPPERFPEPAFKVNDPKTLRHMGIYIIRNLVDEAGFVEPNLGKGNQFRMVIHLKCQ